MSERGGGRFPERWWRHHDGRWYPPSSARHPAARPPRPCEPDDGEPVVLLDLRRGTDIDVRANRSWMAWVLLLGPIAVVAGLVAGMIHGSLEAASPERSHISTGGGSTTSTSVSSGRPRAVPDPVDLPARRGPAPSSVSPGPGVVSSPDATAAAAGLDHARGQSGAGGPAGAAGLDVSVSVSVSGSGASGELGVRTGDGTRPAAPPAGPPGTPLATPTHEDHCKHRGWANLVDDQGQPFPNQGQCVSWVETRQR